MWSFYSQVEPKRHQTETLHQRRNNQIKWKLQHGESDIYPHIRRLGNKNISFVIKLMIAFFCKSMVSPADISYCKAIGSSAADHIGTLIEFIDRYQHSDHHFIKIPSSSIQQITFFNNLNIIILSKLVFL